MSDVLVVIPARMGSTRFPGKPLVELAGRPMVRWTHEAALAAGIGPVVVATPDEEIAEAVRAFGGEAVMTRADHPSGTDRIAEVARSRAATIYVNVQGDEPLVPPEDVRALARALTDAPERDMASLWAEGQPEDAEDPAVVKVVTDLQEDALYFSRSRMPYPRQPAPFRRHLGLYAYRRELLARYEGWSPTPLEQAEGLEQLRFLEHGVRIRMARGLGSEVAVDTPAQAKQASQALTLRSRHASS